jgi:hypothetical protein
MIAKLASLISLEGKFVYLGATYVHISGMGDRIEAGRPCESETKK